MEISKRDYFAAAALTGLLAKSADEEADRDAYAHMACEAFLYADAMLRLSKTLLDPVEIDPNLIGKEEKKKEV
jgi:hypothetical protein